jgi:nitrite reductase/ring-hydroxylating ferredoxin subunit
MMKSQRRMMTEPLPTGWYHEPDVFQRERREVFGKTWQLLARSGQLTEPGDYVCTNLGGWPVFAMVGEDGAPRAFRNVCRHQQLPVLDPGAGRSPQLRCRFHGWTYGFDGRFVTAPPVVVPPDPGNPAHALPRVPFGLWRGLAFVNPDDGAAPLDAALPDPGPAIAGALAAWRFDSEVAVSLNANWKLLVGAIVGREEAPGEARWLWPTLGLWAGDGAAVVRQVVPRTFRRTQLTLYLFLDPALPEDCAASWRMAVKARAEEAKAAAEAAQPDEEGNAGPLPGFLASPLLEGFNAAVRGVHEAA